MDDIEKIEPKVDPRAEKARIRRHVLLSMAWLTLGAIILVLLVGLVSGWRSSLQFSNGFFVAGGIFEVISLLAVFMHFGLRTNVSDEYNQAVPPSHLSENAIDWLADVTQGYNALILFFFSGALLIGLSILVDKVFA